jgi:hypothetical protein
MDIGGILSKVAPWLAAAATGGPAGLAGMAIKTIAGAVGASDQTTEAITAAVAGATPEQLAALKQEEQAFQLKMKELGINEVKDILALEVDDRKDARAMFSTTRSITPTVLSYVITVGFLGMLTGMLLGVFKVSDSQALLIMLGALGAEFAAVCKFWFGTTNEGGRKTEMLANSSPAK